MKPDVSHVLTFIEVVEKRSFTAAAESLRVTKSVVSKHVSALEEALGVMLLKRSTRALLVTEEGRAYYEMVKAIPSQLAEAQHKTQDFLEKPQGELSVIAPVSFAPSLKQQVIPRFLSQYPDISLTINLLASTTDCVTRDDYDVLILGKLQDESFPDYNVVARKMFSMPIGLFATAQYLKQFGVPKTPDQLDQHNCLSSLGFRWPFKQKQGPLYYKEVSGNLRTQSDELISGVVMQHQAIAYSYPFLFLQQLVEKKVRRVMDKYTHLRMDVYACYQPSPYLPAKISVFIDALQQHYQQIQEEVLRQGEV